MFRNRRCFVLAAIALCAMARVVSLAAVRGDEAPQAVVACQTAMSDFDNEVWSKVGVQKCLTCHQKGGDAEDSNFVLLDPRKSEAAARDDAMRHNRALFARMAAVKESDNGNNESRLILKVQGKLDHGGRVVLTPDSAGYRVLADFIRRVQGLGGGKKLATAVDAKVPALFESVVMLEVSRLLRL